MGAAAARELALDEGGVALRDPAGGLLRERAQRGGPAPPEARLQGGTHQVVHVAQLVGQQQLGPAAVVADGRIRLRLRLPQHDLGTREDGQGQAVGLHDGILDQDVDGLPRLLVGEPHQPQILGVDAFHAARHLAAEGLEGRRAVDAVVGRGEGEPAGVRGLGPGRRGLEDGRQEGQDRQQGPGAHGSSVNPGCDGKHTLRIHLKFVLEIRD